MFASQFLDQCIPFFEFDSWDWFGRQRPVGETSSDELSWCPAFRAEAGRELAKVPARSPLASYRRW